MTIAPIETAKIALQLDSKNVYKNSMGNFIRTTIATKGYSGLFVGQFGHSIPEIFVWLPALSLLLAECQVCPMRRGFLIVPRFPAGYFGIAYRQTSWTAAYFSSLESFKQGSSVVIPNSYPKAQAVGSSGSLILPLPRDRSEVVCRGVSRAPHGLIQPLAFLLRVQLAGGMAAGMFGAVFNTPGDVIRSTIQKRALAQMAHEKVPFSASLMMGGVKDFFAVGGEIAATKGVSVSALGRPCERIRRGSVTARRFPLPPLLQLIHLGASLNGCWLQWTIAGCRRSGQGSRSRPCISVAAAPSWRC